jgi:hypothetical protein
MYETPDTCSHCGQPIRWNRWRPYPPAWTGVPSRGDVRDGTCQCRKKYFASRLPEVFFARASARR